MIDLKPEIIFDYELNTVKIILSEDFETFLEHEYDFIDLWQNNYYEDPNHCRIVKLRDVDRFIKELYEIEEKYNFEMMNEALKDALSIDIEYLCNKFVNSPEYLVSSMNFYQKWDRQRYSYELQKIEDD